MDKNTSNSSPSKALIIIGVVIEFLIGLFGIYGFGHFLNKRWKIGIGFLLFSFAWLFVEGVIKDAVLGGVYQPGLIALLFHLPIVFISILFLINNRDSISAKCRKTIEVNLPLEEVVPASELALSRLGAEIVKIDLPLGKIKAKKGASFKSLGTTITISIISTPNGCYMDVLSECTIPTQIIDWGSNAELISDFAHELSVILHVSINPK